MKFMGKLGFFSGSARLGVQADGRLVMGPYSPDAPEATFLAYEVNAALFALQSWLGGWVSLSAGQSPNAWYPVLFAANTGDNPTRFDRRWLNLEARTAKLVFADDEGTSVALITTNGINPYCDCQFDVATGPNFGAQFGVLIKAPGLDEILRSKSAAGMDLNATGAAKVNFSGVRFVEVSFRETQLRDAILDNATFVRCDLTRADMSGASLAHTELADTWIAGSSFERCNLTTTVLPPTPWSDADAPRTNLAGATLPVAKLANNWSFLNLTGTTLLGLADADLNGLTARRCVAPDVVFKGKSLKSADFSESVLDRCDFSRTDLAAAQFGSARLTHSNFSNAQLHEARFDPVSADAPTDLSHSHFSGTQARGAVFKASTLHAATFTAALLSNADFTGARLGELGGPSATFGHAYLENARFDGAWLHGVDFAYATVFGPHVSFRGIHSMTRCNLSNAYFANIDLSGADLRGASLVGACLVNARLARAQLGLFDSTRANLAGCAMQGADFTDAQLDWADLSSAAVALNPGTIPVRYCDANARPFPAPPATLELVYAPTAGIDLETMGPNTICPNGYTVRENLANNLVVYQMLTSPNAPNSWLPSSCAPRTGTSVSEPHVDSAGTAIGCAAAKRST